MTTVMVVDDSEAEQFLIEDLLARYDPTIEMISAEDGRQAMERLAALPALPDLLLLDINMPRMTGFEFLDAWAETAKPAPPIVMCSSSDLDVDRDRALASPLVVAYVVKPVEAHHLDVWLRR